LDLLPRCPILRTQSTSSLLFSRGQWRSLVPPAWPFVRAWIFARNFFLFRPPLCFVFSLKSSSPLSTLSPVQSKTNVRLNRFGLPAPPWRYPVDVIYLLLSLDGLSPPIKFFLLSHFGAAIVGKSLGSPPSLFFLFVLLIIKYP